MVSLLYSGNEFWNLKSNSDNTSGKSPLLQRLKNWLGLLGPGMITAALVFGPSKVTITSKMGAEYGYQLLWVVVVAIFFMVIFTAMAGRIGLASDVSFLTLVKEKWGRIASLATGAGIFLVSASFQAGNSIGIGISIGELFHTTPAPWIVGFNVVGVSLLFFRSFYKVLEKLMILLILLMLVAFFVTLFLSKPALSGVAGGLVPSVPAGSTILVLLLSPPAFRLQGPATSRTWCRRSEGYSRKRNKRLRIACQAY